MDPVQLSIAFAIAFLQNADKLQALFNKTRAEGREPTEEELAPLRAERQKLVADAAAALDGPAPQ